MGTTCLSLPKKYNVFTTPHVPKHSLPKTLLKNPAQTDTPCYHMLSSPSFCIIRGSFRCGNNCLTCNFITDGLTNYTFYSTGEARPIHHHINCNSKNVINMVQCNRCHKQYIGETRTTGPTKRNPKRRDLRTASTNIVDLTNKLTALNPLQSHNIFFQTTVMLMTCNLFFLNRDSVRKARDWHTSSIEVKRWNF